MDCNKQIIINRLNLPNEILDIIKSYSFYDKKTYKMIKTVKDCIKIIDYNFKYISVSRNKPINGYNTETDEHWAFTYNILSNNSIQFQAINCKYCGKYIMSRNYNLIPNKLKCMCYHND